MSPSAVQLYKLQGHVLWILPKLSLVMQEIQDEIVTKLMKWKESKPLQYSVLG